MHFVFDLDGVICTPAKGIQFGIVEYVKSCKPIANVSEFMNWMRKNNHLIIIWCNSCSVVRYINSIIFF